jgi:hypothetical protein
MRQLTALVWKEWRETRAYLFIGLGIFLGFPIVEGIELSLGSNHRFEIDAIPWILALGGVLVMFIAVGSTCRDLNGRVEDFWRSRPIGIVRWLLVKYLVGLLIALAACVVPLIVELFFNRQKDAVLVAVWYPFLWMAIYSSGFLTGVLLRRTAHAAMLGLAAMLMIYFVPVVFPPLQWLNSGSIVDFSSEPGNWPQLLGHGRVAFACGMVGLALALLVFATIATRRSWQIESGRKLMYGSVSAAFLILFASAAFQLGTNMPVLETVDLPIDEAVSQIRYSPNGSFLITRKTFDGSSAADFGEWASERMITHQSRRINFTASGVTLGEPHRLKVNFGYGSKRAWAFSAEHPELLYLCWTIDESDGDDVRFHHKLWIVDLATGQITVGPELWSDRRTDNYQPRAYCIRNRLYVAGNKLATLDVGDPLSPKLMSLGTLVPLYGMWENLPELVFPLPELPELSNRERLELVIGLGWDPRLEGDLMCMPVTTDRENGWGLASYRLVELTDKLARFRRIGLYQPSMLESIASNGFFYDSQLKNGYYYGAQGGAGRVLNQSISVFDAVGAKPMKLVGHFAAPGASVVCPLPDGRALVGGSKLWVVGPPPNVR